MDKKVFKTLDEQVNMLKERGLIINDPEYAKKILFKESYFFLHGYRFPFLKSMENRVYINNTTFEEVYSLFLFDRNLRNLLFKNILIIENNIKSVISYNLSLKYGYREKDYLNAKNYNSNPEKRRQVNDLLNKMKKQIQNNVSSHSATLHYNNKYGYIPFWVAVKVLSFGIISEFFTILNKEEQYDIVDNYNIDIDDFSDYLNILANYRNLCAHENIVYDNKSNKIIQDSKYHRLLNIPIMNNEYIYGKNDLFVVFIIFKELLTNDEFVLFIVEFKKYLSNLGENIKSISITKILDRMGIPVNWEDLIKFNK